jgi:hypothetical protein
MINPYELRNITDELINVCQMEEVDVTPYLEKVLNLLDFPSIVSAFNECKERLGESEYEFLIEMVLDSAIENLSGNIEFRTFHKQNSLAFRTLTLN